MGILTSFVLGSAKFIPGVSIDLLNASMDVRPIADKSNKESGEVFW